MNTNAAPESSLAAKATALIAFLYGLSTWGVPAADPDLGWHLLGGRWIIEHGRLPDFDIINSFNAGWQDYHWLAQIFMYQLYKFGGYPLLQIVFAIMVAYTAKIIVDIAMRYRTPDANPLAIFLASLGAVFLLNSVSSVRPQMIALLGGAFALRRLSLPPTRWELPVLMLLTAILANCHVYWVIIPFLYFCFRVLPPQSSGKLISCTLIFLSALVSPYGTANYSLLLDYLLMSGQLRSFIQELKPGFSADGYVPLVLVLFCAVIARQMSWEKFRAQRGEYAAFLISFGLTLRALKFLPLFGLTALPLAVPGLSSTFANRRLSGVAKCIFSACLLHSGYLCISGFPLIADHTEVARMLLPVEACSKLATLEISPQPGRDHLRVLTHFNHGGWCRWAAYEANSARDIRVTTDGRTQWVKDSMLRDSFNLYGLKLGWAETLAHWSPDAILVGKDQALGQFLSYSNAWKIAHQDEYFAIFTRR